MARPAQLPARARDGIDGASCKARARLERASPAERRVHARKVKALTEYLPAPADFSRLHGHVRPHARTATQPGDIRKAFVPA